MNAFVRMGKLRYFVSLLVVFSVLFAFGSVFASSEGGHEAPATEPPIRLLWRAMNFVVLAGGLAFLLRKPIAKGLESRRQGIKDELADLEAQKQEAERRLAEYKEKLSQLDKEVETIVAEYIREGETAKAKIIEEAQALSEKLKEQAKKNIEHEFDKAKLQLKAEMAGQAVAMAEQLIKEHINEEDQERIVDEYLTKVVVAQ